MGSQTYRDVSPLVKMVRSFLLGRNSGPSVRFSQCMSPRTQPQPNIPTGMPRCPGVPYCERDAPRLMEPPAIIGAPGKAGWRGRRTPGDVIKDL